jgi:hypothetical protein
MGLNPAGAIIRGIGLLMSETTFLEKITYRDAWRVERWYAQLTHDIARMIEAWKSDRFDRAEDHACSNYGGCIYRHTCFHHAGQERLLGPEFAARDWNPLAKDPMEQRLGWRD